MKDKLFDLVYENLEPFAPRGSNYLNLPVAPTTI